MVLHPSPGRRLHVDQAPALPTGCLLSPHPDFKKLTAPLSASHLGGEAHTQTPPPTQAPPQRSWRRGGLSTRPEAECPVQTSEAETVKAVRSLQSVAGPQPPGRKPAARLWFAGGAPSSLRMCWRRGQGGGHPVTQTGRGGPQRGHQAVNHHPASSPSRSASWSPSFRHPILSRPQASPRPAHWAPRGGHCLGLCRRNHESVPLITTKPPGAQHGAQGHGPSSLESRQGDTWAHSNARTGRP